MFRVELSPLAQTARQLDTRSLLSWTTLVSAISLGFWLLWQHSENNAVAAIFLLFTSCLATVLIGSLFSTKIARLLPLTNLWVGGLLATVALLDYANFPHTYPDDVMKVLFLMHGLLEIAGATWDTSRGAVPAQLFPSSAALLEWTGLLVVGFYITDTSVAVMLCAALIISYALCLDCLWAAPLGVAYLSCLVTYIYPVLLQQVPNSAALFAVAARLWAKPLASCYFHHTTRIARWSGLITARRRLLALLFFIFVILDLTTTAVHLNCVFQHKEWYVVMILFFLALCLWLCYHLALYCALVVYARRFYECGVSLRARGELEDANLLKIMACKGLRHFSLLSRRLVLLALLSSMLLWLLVLQSQNLLSVALAAASFPLQLCLLSLVHLLATELAGTCLGYALVTPFYPFSAESPILLLPPDTINSLAQRSSNILSHLQHLFGHHLIEQYGCDYMSSGISTTALEEKLHEFFSRLSPAGVAYDTYVLYFAGLTRPNGDLLLNGGSYSFTQLCDIWCQSPCSAARLILVVDSPHSHRWLPQVRACGSARVSLQTYVSQKSDVNEIGEFTRSFVVRNTLIDLPSVMPHPSAGSSAAAATPRFAVSPSWHDTRAAPPDLETYLAANFPLVIQRALWLFSLPCLESGTPCCELIGQLRRCFYSLRPPQRLDTGHGFSLTNY